MAEDVVDRDATDNVTRIGTGGRLYRDARDKDADVERRLRIDKEDQADTVSVGDFLRSSGRAAMAPPTPPPAPPRPMMTPKAAPKTPKTPKAKVKVALNWRNINSTAMELAGVTALTAGFWMLTPWVGLVVLGLCLILMGVATGLPSGTPAKKG